MFTRIAPARLVIEPDGRGRLTFPYDARLVAAIKADLPAWAREWDPLGRAWLITPSWIPDALAVVRQYAAVVTDEPARPAYVPASTWAEQLHDRFPEHLRAATFRALLRVVHPDVGGDASITRELVSAFRSEQRWAS